MNNDIENMKNHYYLEVNFIGEGENSQKVWSNLITSLKVKNINKLASQKKEEDLVTLFDYWDYHCNFEKTFKEQCNNLFKHFNLIKNENLVFKSCLVVRVNQPDSPEVKYILSKMDELDDKDYMPLVLFLCDDKITFSEDSYPNIDKRMIFSEKYIMSSHYSEDQKNPIHRTLINFCSIFNELGDKFTIGKGDKVIDYCLTNKIFPFNLNIICLGRIRQGKSTCVNSILNEMRARESDLGLSQTKNITYYQVNNYPIKILDIPGFENKETVIKAVEYLKELKTRLEKIKDRIHIILYVIDFLSNIKFIEDEIIIFKELINHNEAKVIYVFTKSSKIKKKQKKTIEKTQESIYKLIKNSTKNEEIKIKKKMEISENNCVFVNFIGDEDNKKHGVKELFSKIKFFFQRTDSYKNAFKRDIKKEAQELRERAKDELLSYKIGGGLVGVLPGVDLLVQKFFIKKNAINKISQIFGIDIDEIEKYERVRLERQDIDDDIRDAGSLLASAANIGGGALVSSGTGELVEIVTTTFLKETSYIKFFSWELFKTTTTTVLDTSTTVARVGVNGLRIGLGVALSAVMSVVGIGLGAYSTHKQLNELVEKFYNLYLEYGPIIVNSYFRAEQYLIDMELKNQ